ncbi:MAG TPA: hypothetical protein VFE54_11485 [Mucilaginibacter sp.]|nr:hypothetical protein [Mucilaginibacter sp.]
MRKFLKVFMPPLIGFTAFFVAVRYGSQYNSLRLDEMGEGTLRSFMAYYRYFWPLLFIVGLITQVLIVVPIWYRVKAKAAGPKMLSFFILCLVCLLFAVVISYIIWEKQSGLHHLIKLCIFMTGIQVIYWMMDILTMALLNVRLDEEDDKKDIEPAK